MNPERGATEVGPDEEGDGRERFSGLRISGRKIRAQRWDDLMRGKRYVSFDRLSAALGNESEENVVTIVVVYGKSLPKGGANGSRYAHWSLTDLAFPKPQVMTLLLYSQAFDTWVGDATTDVPTGAIFAVLNPLMLPDKEGGESRLAAKVSHATQLVHLGTCPSLGLCTSRKKDGVHCSMPCDRDRGPLVCYYHTMHQEAQKVKRFAQSAKGVSERTLEATSKPSIFVIPGPSSKAATVPSPLAPVKSIHARSASRFSAKEVESMKRLLAQPIPKKPERSPPVEPAKRPPATPSRNGWDSATGSSAKPRPAEQPTQPSPSEQPQKPLQRVKEEGSLPAPAAPGQMSTVSPGPAPVSARTSQEQAVLKRFKEMYPDGIPEPDPNNSLYASQTQAAQRAAKLRWPLPRSKPEQPHQALPSRPAPSARGLWADGSGAQCTPKCGSSKAANGPTMRKLESEFGRKAAVQLAAATDPRKDLVRQQGSRFQGLVEQERAAQRMRRLGELEMQDAAAEKLEEVMSMTVQVYKCKQCASLFETSKRRIACEAEGHQVSQVQATRTRWECQDCKWSEYVLDRRIDKCRRCRGMNFKQVPLRGLKRAPLDRDMFHVRGEELPFINSIFIAGQPAKKRMREAEDDYAGM